MSGTWSKVEVNEGVSREDRKDDDVWLRANWCNWRSVTDAKGKLEVITESRLVRGSKLFDNRKEKGGLEKKIPKK